MYVFRFCIGLALAASMATASANANTRNGTFTVTKYLWCNGPVSDVSQPSSCSFQGWHQVDLDHIALVQIDFSEEKKLFKLMDTSDVTWEKDLSECDESPSRDNCWMTITDSDDDGYSISIVEPIRGSSQSRSLRLKFDDNKLSVNGPGRSAIIFEVERSE